MHLPRPEQSIFVYKLISDTGAAPCVQAGLLSLAICKPQIRKQARPGDWIIGFGASSRSELKGRLIYIAQVAEVLREGAYYADPTCSERRDCIYRKEKTGYSHLPNPYHDADCLPHDLGDAPAFDRAIVLLASRFVYFGGKNLMPIDAVREDYEHLPRNYRRHHDEPERKRWEFFIANVLKQFSTGAHGKPTHSVSRAACVADCEAEESAEPARVYAGCGSC